RSELVAAADEVPRRCRGLPRAARPVGAPQPVGQGAVRLGFEVLGGAEPADDLLRLDALGQRPQPLAGVALLARLPPRDAGVEREAEAFEVAGAGVFVLAFGDGAVVAGLDVAVAVGEDADVDVALVQLGERALGGAGAGGGEVLHGGDAEVEFAAGGEDGGAI